MAAALTRENFVLHKLHSLTGVLPVGYYMAQHLILNTFSLGGPDKFNGVIAFFDSMPKYFLITIETCLIWIPLLFHAVYGLFITGRAQPNFLGSKYGWSQNRMYTLQRYTGVFLFFFLMFHVASTTGVKYVTDSSKQLMFAAWHERLTEYGYAFLILYALGVFTASYHLGYGIWNFCIRWGITVSDQAQQRIQKFSFVFFVFLTLTGWAALGGFLMNHPAAPAEATVSTPAVPPLPVGTYR